MSTNNPIAYDLRTTSQPHLEDRMRIWPGSADSAPERGRRPRFAALGAAVTAIVLASACGSSNSPHGAAVPGVDLVTPGKLKVCTNLPYAPFQFTRNGKNVGFDVELMDLVAKKLGVTQELVDIDFDSIKGGTALNARRCDVAAAGMTITEDRKRNLAFSDPYFDEAIALVAPKGTGVKTLEDVKAKKLSLGVQASTTSLDFAKSKGFDPKQYKDSGKELLALQSGQVKVILQDLPVVNTWMKKPDLSAKYELGATITTGSQYGFAVKKAGSPELLKTIDQVLSQAIADGTWAKAYTTWMGSAPAAIPKRAASQGSSSAPSTGSASPTATP
jgi:polar amino acid transport system substrate-binding protein